MLLFTSMACQPFRAPLPSTFVPTTKDQNKSEQILHLCDVLRTPGFYNGQHVTIRATYRAAFENSQLYCLACLDQGGVWMEPWVDQYYEPTKSVRKLFKLERKGHMGYTANGIFSGIFHGPGRYGHQGVGEFELEVEEVRDLKLVVRTGVVASFLPAEARKRVCQ